MFIKEGGIINWEMRLDSHFSNQSFNVSTELVAIKEQDSEGELKWPTS